MQNILIIVHLIITVALVGTVLMQRSEGGALGMGGGGSGNLFSSRGVGNALTRMTALLAAGFFATSIALAVLATHKGGSIFDSVAPASQVTPAQTTVPAPGSGSLLPKLGGDTAPAVPAQPKTP
jgi:preprotein translocase subunit SecG